jgi:predicted nucleic acid-binding Zn ribbon protein
LHGQKSFDEPLSDEELNLASIKQRPSRLNAKTIGSVVKQLVARRGYGETESHEQLQAAWAKAAGPQLAALTQATKVSKGALVVLAENHTVLQELSFQRRQILQELQKQLPEMNIKGLRPKVGRT